MAKRSALVVEIDLSRGLEESSAGPSLFRSETTTLYEAVEAVRRAAADRRVAGLLLRADAPEIGWSRAESLHRALRRFAASEKPSFAFLSRAGNTAYLAASAARTIVLDPSSTLDLESPSSESFFLKDLLGDLGIVPELDRVGEFKSAGEIFERRSSSTEHRLQIDEILAEVQDGLASYVSRARSIPLDEVTKAIHRGPLLPEEALELRLVDSLGPEEGDAAEFLESHLGAPVRLVPHRRYLAKGRFRRRLRSWRRPRVAVVHAAGVITTGDGRRARPGPRAIGARELTELLAALRADRRVKAIVLRVDSPGGGASASDRIRRGILGAVREKPVVISMGDVAASGGYYIATAASSVVAESLTLTGSIGVIGGKFVIQKLLDRLGIHHESRSAGTNSGFLSPLRSFRPEERARHQEFLLHFYRTKFLPAVAEGRSLPVQQADSVGRGRVWTGSQARERGLVDVLGGLEEAIDRACEAASLERSRTRIVPFAPRRRLRDFLLPGRIASPLGHVGDWLALVEDLAREDLLLLMPRLLRIR